MTFKAFVSNRVRAAWLRNDLAFVQEQSYPFQRRVAVHVARRLAQVDEAGADGTDGRNVSLKKIASNEEYALSASQQAESSDVYASRMVLHWLEAYSALRQDAEYYELVESGLWSFINSILTPAQVAELLGIPNPDPVKKEEPSEAGTAIFRRGF